MARTIHQKLREKRIPNRTISTDNKAGAGGAQKN